MKINNKISLQKSKNKNARPIYKKFQTPNPIKISIKIYFQNFIIIHKLYNYLFFYILNKKNIIYI